MDLVVTTPGVSTAPLRAAIQDRGELLVFDRARRCGTTAVDPAEADRLRVAVVPCAVSLHAADRLRRRFERETGGEGRISVDGVIVAPAQSGSAADRFDGRRSRSTIDRLVARVAERFGCSIVRIDPEDRRSARRRV
ncbi:MAG: hypothetical protein ACOC0Z_00010 [Halohasta sp.]